MQFKDETAFNLAVRGVLRAQGLRCIHVREADMPGPLDLVVWNNRALACWIELKVDDEPLNESQKEFIRNNYDCCIVMRWLTVADCMLWWPARTVLESRSIPVRQSWIEFATKWAPELARWTHRTNVLIAE